MRAIASLNAFRWVSESRVWCFFEDALMKTIASLNAFRWGSETLGCAVVAFPAINVRSQSENGGRIIFKFASAEPFRSELAAR